MGKITISDAQKEVDKWIKTYGVRYFNELTNMYPQDPNFAKSWKACKESITLDHTRQINYMIEDGMVEGKSTMCSKEFYEGELDQG